MARAKSRASTSTTASKANAPINVYIHGGAWRNGRSADFAFLAEMIVDAGAHSVIVDFNNIDDVGGDLMAMAKQVRAAVAWVYKNAQKFGGDPNRLYVTGHSSGGHLSGCVVTTDWQKDFGLPKDIVKGAMLASGMYDLKPVRLSKRSKYVNFTDEIEQELSAHPPSRPAQLPDRGRARHRRRRRNSSARRATSPPP